jgi:hypothetical protein
MRKLRGCKSGTPDTFVLYLGTLVALEMKSRVGKVSPAQRLVREGLLRAGVRDWWVCRTARSTMWALAESGVRFREIVRADGTIVCWQQPELPAWEVPKRNPQERRPWAPKWEPETAAQIAELQEVSRLQSEATAAIFYRSIGAGPASDPAAAEGPFADPHRRLPQEPRVAAQRREEQRRYRERQRARKAANGDIAA